MKKILLFLTVAIAAMSLQAAPVDPAQAAKTAKNYLAEVYAGKIMAPAALNPVLLKTEYGSDVKLKQPAYYIYNTSTTFLVVAGDDRAEQILMVGDKPLSLDRIPDGLQYLLDCYKEQIDFLQANPKIQVERPSEARHSLNAVTYGPLLTATWDQMDPYWDQCVFTYNNRSYQCLTGCPATSASMVLYYWKYPTTQVPALASYTSTLELSRYSSVNFTYPSLSATTFDWGNMKDSYTSGYTTAQGNAVATLMRYVGQLEKMMYGTESAGGSGILTTKSADIATMFKTLGYDSNTRLVNKSAYSATNWANLIIAEMAASRPVVYLGVSGNAGHAFNVDGYRDSDSKYHVNFGWSGDGNNWFAMNAFSYSGYTFSSNQQAIVGIQPPGGQTVTPELTVNPTSLTFTANTGETVTKTFTVNASDLYADVTLSYSGNSQFTISPSTLTAAQAMAGATVTVTYKPTVAGSQTGTITVASSGATSRTVTLSGTSVTVPTINASETSLSFSTEAGTPVTKTFLVTASNLSGSIRLAASGTGFSVSPSVILRNNSLLSSTGVVVTVTYNPSAAGSHTGTVTLTSDGAETRTVALNGTATAPARTITATPNTLTFNALVGATASQTFTVTGENLNGNITLALNDANGVYAITPTTISAADAINGVPVTVTYNPTVFGSQNATITLTGGGASAVTVNLTGLASIVKYAPVMQPVNETYVALTQFRADWTDETPAENLLSYTLEVSPKVVEPVLLHSLTGSSYTGNYADITLSAPWAGLNVRGGNNAIYIKNNYLDVAQGYITYTIPEGYTNATFTVVVSSSNNSYGVGDVTISTPQTAAVSHNFVKNETCYWLVTASSGEKITIISNDASYSPDMRLIAVYSGDARPATLMATETGDANYRLIEGITPDKFYTVKDLTAEGTFLYRVKALYIDGTESAWSNIEEVTLFNNPHPYPQGDVDHNGNVDINDVTVMIEYVLKGGDICFICGDLNSDEKVDIDDVTLLIDRVLKGNATLAAAANVQYTK